MRLPLVPLVDHPSLRRADLRRHRRPKRIPLWTPQLLLERRRKRRILFLTLLLVLAGSLHRRPPCYRRRQSWIRRPFKMHRFRSTFLGERRPAPPAAPAPRAAPSPPSPSVGGFAAPQAPVQAQVRAAAPQPQGAPLQVQPGAVAPNIGDPHAEFRRGSFKKVAIFLAAAGLCGAGLFYGLPESEPTAPSASANTGRPRERGHWRQRVARDHRRSERHFGHVSTQRISAGNC